MPDASSSIKSNKGEKKPARAKRMASRRTSSYRIELSHSAVKADLLEKDYPVEQQKRGYITVRLEIYT